MIQFDKSLYTSELQVVGEDLSGNTIWGSLKLFFNGLDFQFSYSEQKSRTSPPYYEIEGKGLACAKNSYVFKLENYATLKFMSSSRSLADITLHFRNRFLTNYVSIVVSLEPATDAGLYKPNNKHVIN